MQEWFKIDEQMATFGPRLRDDLKISPDATLKLATTIADEIRRTIKNHPELLDNLVKSPIEVKNRRDELLAFQGFMDICNNNKVKDPSVIRAQVCYQNYICFVYLGDIWFKAFMKNLDHNPSLRKCCKRLTNNPIRAFRNAIAHGNWRYLSDFSGIEFWAKKGSNQNKEMTRFEVSQDNLHFWQALARCVAYCIAEILLENSH
ncbi:MAG: hypothetical protein B6I25_03380 [Planctomycetales bacterium 4572_13]|nr:MAG: hypothetical protein B6I25_03380 [Planctomycetales bacterium 4572_13]